MNILPPIVSASDLQRDSSRIINLAKNSDQPVVVVRNNKPEIAMLSAQKLQKMIDRLEELEAKELERDLAQTEKDYKAGKLKSTTDFSEFLDD